MSDSRQPAPQASTTSYVVAGRPGVRVAASHLGMACCAVEFAAAVSRGLLVPDPDPGRGSDPAAAHELSVLVVAGTVTHALAPQVVAAWEALPEPRAVLSFGACSSSGGPYWDSYSVAAGIDDVVPVAAYVPGCPPRPEALVDVLVGLVP